MHPRPLPIDAFTIAWKELGADARRLFFSEAAIMASERLALQKGRTGMAILGKPLAEVASTLAGHLSDSISSGEAFAQASLTSELLVCLVTKVSRDDFHFYIGRGQFPKIVNKPIDPKNKKGYFWKNYWSI